MFILKKHTDNQYILSDTDFIIKYSKASSFVRASVKRVNEAYPTHPFFKLDLAQIKTLIPENSTGKEWEVEVEMDGSDCKITDGFINIVKIVKILNVYVDKPVTKTTIQMSEKEFLAMKISEYLTSEQIINGSFINSINIMFDNQKVLEERIKLLEEKLK